MTLGNRAVTVSFRDLNLTIFLPLVIVILQIRGI